MRVVVAPDSFGGSLSAVEAAAAISEGWLRRAPGDDVVLAPMSDGGNGLVDVLHARLGGELLSLTVLDHRGDETPAAVLMVEDTAYVESAQACGLGLGQAPDAERATSYGVGQLVAAAIDDGARTVVVGLGESAAGDGGAGLIAGLGAVADPPEALMGGAHAIELLETVDLGPLRERVDGVSIVGACDVDIPLLGLRGTTNLAGADRGLADDRLVHVDAQLERLAHATGSRLASAKFAGAGGGMGFAVLLAGGTCADGVAVAAEALGLAALVRSADLVVTGEGSFDYKSGSGTVPAAVAALAGEAIRPCIALAGRVLVGAREMRALGVESAYSVVDLVGEDAALSDPSRSLAALAERVARTWSR